MKRNHNAVAAFALIKKSKRLYEANKINKLQHMKNMNYILKKLDALLVDKQHYDYVLDVLCSDNNANDISLLVDKLITLIN